MDMPFETILLQAETWRPFLENLKAVFQDMDREYQKSAAGYGFHCQGCEKTCCATRFYHHTLLELLYIYEGWQAVAPKERKQIVRRASNVCRAYMEKGNAGDRILCPLNADNRCMLYAYRPMICRMHGIPHKLHHPVKGVVNGPGCHMFNHLRQEKGDFRFDRTPFYTSIARLERKLRQAMRITTKIRFTVANMVVFVDGKKAS